MTFSFHRFQLNRKQQEREEKELIHLNATYLKIPLLSTSEVNHPGMEGRACESAKNVAIPPFSLPNNPDPAKQRKTNADHSHYPILKPPKMHVDPNATTEEQNQVLTWLREFNEAHNGAFMKALANDAEEAFFLVARNDQNEVIGGIAGTLLLKWLKIYVTAVSPDHQGQGIGKDLLAKAEQHALSKGCQYAYVDTMSFQAPEFYLKSGYEEVGRYKDWDSHGHDKIYFQKVL